MLMLNVKTRKTNNAYVYLNYMCLSYYLTVYHKDRDRQSSVALIDVFQVKRATVLWVGARNDTAIKQCGHV